MILLMILFHLNYSLTHIFNSEIINFSGSFWYVIGRVAALGFMIISGVSFFLAREKYWVNITKKYLKYAGILSILALSISLITAFLIPEQLILFGILHLFAVSFMLLPIFAKTEYYSWIIAMMLIVWGSLFSLQTQSQILFPLWWTTVGFYSADYYPLVPYFWYILWGFFIGKCLRYFEMFRYFSVNRELIWWEKLLSSMWKKSLLLYLVHQPIIIVTLYVFFKYISVY
jgi:uncharacterized membrane protein